jgi:hypothetical protein
MNDIVTLFRRLHRPDGADELLLAVIPTLNRLLRNPLLARKLSSYARLRGLGTF